jgi:hypothetical protein
LIFAGRDDLDLRAQVVRRAEAEHLARFAKTADQGAGDDAAL